VTTHDGKVLNYQITFLIVHGIYNEKYIFRQNLMDVIIHNLMTNNKSKIKCKKYIRKLSVYKDLVAALTTDKVCVYQLNEEDTAKVPTYQIKWEGELNLILLTSNHLLICLDNRLLLYGLTKNTGNVEREWSFEADIKYLRVIGGAVNREALIGGLKNGEIYMIYIDNQFPVLLYQHDIPIRSLDVNCNRKKLAIVDENYDIFIVEIATKTILWKDAKAKSVAFNSEIEDMISYWYDGNVYIKTADFPPIAEKMNGVIVGFRGTKVFLLQSMNNINVLDISHSTSIMKYSEKKEYTESYKVACLGATNQEWLYLGFEALLNFDLTTAVNSFKKLQDIKLINLCFKVEQDLKDGVNKDVIRGDILCYMGRYKEAEEAYVKGEKPEKAMDMYTVLKMWADAMRIMDTYLKGRDININNDVLLKQAEWLYENGKFVEAADLFWALGKKKRAIEIYGERGMLDKLIEICRSLNKEDAADLIALCGFYFKKHKHYQYATEAYLKLGDLKALVHMNVELQRWEEAFLLAQPNKNLLEYVYLQYAEFLITQDRFKEAQQAYKKAGRTDLSMKLLEKLIDNAVYEKRHKDACFLLICYSSDALTLIKDFNTQHNKAEIEKVKEYKNALELADIFYSYDAIYKYIEEPFSSELLTIDNYGLFNSCKYLVNKVSSMKTKNRQISGVNLAYVFYALGFLSKQLESYKTARFSFEKLNTLNFPSAWQGKIDFEIMSIRSKPYTDKDTNMPLCFRCLNSNPLINLKGDKCTICQGPFIRSPISQEILPLIEFRPIPEISDTDAIEIIKSSSMAQMQKPNLLEAVQNTGNVIVFNQDHNSNEDLFGNKLIEWCEGNFNREGGMFLVDEDVLKSLNETEVKYFIYL
jgi:intraflagellar transport protein 122